MPVLSAGISNYSLETKFKFKIQILKICLFSIEAFKSVCIITQRLFWRAHNFARGDGGVTSTP